MTNSADEKRPLRGAAAAQAGFDYQLDVSILAALQLLLISKAATRLVLEPVNEEDLEADLEHHVPGRLQSSATVAGGYKLVVQVKMDNGEPWSIEDFEALLKHGSEKKGGRRKALHHLDEPNTRYLLVTNADAKGVARGLLVEGFEEVSDKASFPPSLHATLKTSPEGRVAIWGKLTEKQLASDIRALMSDLLHVPKVEQLNLLQKLRLEARRRTRGSTPGLWTSDDLLATVRAHGGFLASSASLEHFVPPANFDEMLKVLNDKNAVVIRGPSGTGKTQAALKLCDIARRRNGVLEVVTVGADDAPTSVRKIVNNGPTLFYVDDPWGQFSLRGGSEAWTEQLPRLLAKATPDHQFIVTSRSDMMQSAKVGDSLNAWSVELDASQYRDGQLRDIHDNRMDQLPAALQTKAYAFRNEVLDRLGTPLEIELYFAHMQTGPDVGEEDHVFFRRLLELAQRDAVEGVVLRALSSIDTCGTSAIVWALLAARGQFDRSRLHPLQRALRGLDRALGDGLDRLIDRMVAARHLRQPARTIAFAHPSVRQGFEAFAKDNWGQSEAAIETLIAALAQLPSAHRDWGFETAARIFEVTRSFARREDVDQTFDIDSSSQEAIDAWLDESLMDPASKFEPLLELASEVGSDASIPSRVARWLLKGTQRGASFFVRNWQPPIFDDAWYDTVAASPFAAKVAERFIREQLGFDRGNYGSGFAKRLDRLAPNLTSAYHDAARQMVGNGFELNADAVAAGAVRDLDGFESVVQAALDDLASIHRQHVQSGREEWRAIEDGERDHAVEEAAQSTHEGDGYTSGVFIDAYVQQLRAEGRWLVLANHRRVAELVRAWSKALVTSSHPVDRDELLAIVAASRDMDNEPTVWAAVRKHWVAALEPELFARVASVPSAVDLRNELVLTALEVAPNALITAFKMNCKQLDRQIKLLTSMQESRRRFGKSSHAELSTVVGALPDQLKEVFDAFPTKKRKARAVSGLTLMLLTGCAPQLDAEALDLVVPVILASKGDASAAIAQWLKIASCREHAVSATEAAIAIGDTTLVQAALRHQRADARRAALLHLSSASPNPLPPEILEMASDPGSRVRGALADLLAERPHPDHLKILFTLIHDTWSSAAAYFDEPPSFDIARAAVVALADYIPLSDEIGDSLVDLANTTVDRTLSKYALIVAANCCSSGIQQKIWSLINISEARWIRLDAIDALADADSLSLSIVGHLTPDFLLHSPAIVAAPAAHLVGAHATANDALKLFERIANSNKRRALLLVGANAMAGRDRATADRILDLLEPGHPGRQLLAATEPLSGSILDDLGEVRLREAVRTRLGDRIVVS
ncbi:HEAT repeat domain-containing protein [Pseudoxanthomonas mexicana]|uniref:HEAT repeat domain-containing protein n=1 Tax=Pseudoxanthomonas mexicana TaxID=128785 RepID=UPI0028AEEC96|nr:hypothetical protein [Pseudoxanthomonas mexicana]